MEELAPNEKNIKKQYQSPELKSFGKVGEVTKTTGSGTSDDGAGNPNYAS